MASALVLDRSYTFCGHLAEYALRRRGLGAQLLEVLSSENRTVLSTAATGVQVQGRPEPEVLWVC